MWPSASPQLESSRTSSLLKYLTKTWGGFWVKIHGSIYQPAFVDIVGCWRGLFVAFEVKRPGKHATPRQLLTLGQIERAGGVTGVIWQNDDAKRILQKVLDSLADGTYIGSTNQHRAEYTKEKHQMPTKSRSRRSSNKAANKPVAVIEDEDELEDLDDLEDLEDFIDSDEDEDEEEEDEEEDEEPAPTRNGRRTSSKASNVATATKTKESRRPSAVTTRNAPSPAKVKGSKTKSSNGSAPPRRQVAAGKYGASYVASEAGVDGRAVRILFRKEGVQKAESGLYELSKKEADALVKKVKASNR